MILYTEKLLRGESSNISFYAAKEAFYNMGFQLTEVNSFEQLRIEEDHVFLGGITFMHAALSALKRKIPEPVDYPSSLKDFFGRSIWASSISQISNNPEFWNVFVKPRGIRKKFAGRLVRGTADLIGTSSFEVDTPVWVSEPVEFVAEWRVFVRYGQILGVRPYKGDWRCQYDPEVIRAAVSEFSESPKAYAIDFGRTKEGRFLVVEVNEGYSLGSYGLFYVDYAKLLCTRWCELTGQKDLCLF